MSKSSPEGFCRGFKRLRKKLGKMAKKSDTSRHTYSRTTQQLRLEIRDAREVAAILDAELRGLVLRGSGLTDAQRDAVKTRLFNWSHAIKLRKKVGRPAKKRAGASRGAAGSDVEAR